MAIQKNINNAWEKAKPIRGQNPDVYVSNYGGDCPRARRSRVKQTTMAKPEILSGSQRERRPRTS